MKRVEEITVWVCDECGYWRQNKSTGRHQTDDPNNWRGKQVIHDLKPRRFVRYLTASEENEESEDE